MHISNIIGCQSPKQIQPILVAPSDLISKDPANGEIMQVNSASMRADGKTLIKRELKSLDQLRRNTAGGIVEALPKLRPGMDKRAYRRVVRERIERILEKTFGPKPGGN